MMYHFLYQEGVLSNGTGDRRNKGVKRMKIDSSVMGMASARKYQKDVLYRLAEKGVGAVCLRNVSTEFTVKGQDGRTKGAVRSTGIFLYENGSAGTVQHVDVAKYTAQA